MSTRSAAGAVPSLSTVVAAVEAEGERLRAEFHRPDGPRGRSGDAPIDLEIEERLKAALQPLLPSTYAGEESGTHACDAETEYVWLVDPQDGTYDFTAGRRGSAISVALLRGIQPVLAVIHSPLSPDRGHDTIAWREGEPLQRNGKPVCVDLRAKKLSAGELVWTTASASQRPQTVSRAVAPARFVAMPSIAYRLARVAAGDGIAAISLHGVNEYDFAAGLALVRASGGIMLDAEGREVDYTGICEQRVTGCFAGAPDAVRSLAKFPWKEMEIEPRRAARVALGFPRREDARLQRAQGCLAGLIVGDSLGAGGAHHTIAGQPLDAGEMALVLSRTLFTEKEFASGKVQAAYREWLLSRPVDVAVTTQRGLLGLHTTESESNGSLMRVAPIGIWAAGDPARAAATAREDSALTHPNPLCVEACAGYCAAIAAGIGGASPDAMTAAALAHSGGPARDAIERGAARTSPEFTKNPSWALTALQNAFACLMHCAFEESVMKTIAAGGDTHANAAVAGALLGAAHGISAIPSHLLLPVLACRPLAEAGAPRPRPMEMWPDDVLELAEALLWIIDPKP